MAMVCRIACQDDIPAMATLIGRSARQLCRADYTEDQVEAALRGAWGVDTQLVRDGTYLVVEEAGAMLGCGGWSFRRTLFGGDAYADRVPERLDPARDRAKVRAFFVDPKQGGRGVGRLILTTAEAAARAAGFTSFELMATLTGVPFYRRCGYEGEAQVRIPLEPGIDIDFVPMTKGIVRDQAIAGEGSLAQPAAPR
ncbi:hypothetical protein PB2503_05222 [Parvularcula bermudensis HTCC2503]|uniref:N-acetyltransferase domain-containing protein n=1 Tax=Parvularcula bermudensis (strain ATCC BAA-594 / HTCC2503 / KCTC 12087) TaxID=314260 RepID=E0TFV4_PARBH|nr:GNAT family N-acetyltransferase [Parvularcula bermudensis]ADM09119.1 hypothetical protein PB2503_05222 [Parvularcula bermudensis HTCC2503]